MGFQGLQARTPINLTKGRLTWRPLLSSPAISCSEDLVALQEGERFLGGEQGALQAQAVMSPLASPCLHVETR